MPINSKYTNAQVESLIGDLLGVLAKHDANIELSLMCLGNAASYIIHNQIPKAQQQDIVDTFNKALSDTVKNSQ